MNELNQGLLGTAALVPSFAFEALSWMGGRAEHYLGVPNWVWKKIIAPIFFVISVIGFSALAGAYSNLFWIALPNYLAQTQMGYGGKSLSEKFYRRSLWSIARTMAALPFAIVTGAWVLFILQAVIGLISTLTLGIKNPLQAPQEEGLINFLSVIFIPFMLL